MEKRLVAATTPAAVLKKAADWFFEKRRASIPAISAHYTLAPTSRPDACRLYKPKTLPRMRERFCQAG